MRTLQDLTVYRNDPLGEHHDEADRAVSEAGVETEATGPSPSNARLFGAPMLRRN